jgi:hypothetical protein
MDLSSALVERVDAVFADMDKPEEPGTALLVIDHGERLIMARWTPARQRMMTASRATSPSATAAATTGTHPHGQYAAVSLNNAYRRAQRSSGRRRRGGSSRPT